ncbi:MAG: polysaccharide deacetylase family protein [Nitrospirae bacterium]|nr:polysaccharide deacetylase family protein [Nitrospirota bacterium]
MGSSFPILVYHQIVPDDFSVVPFPPGDRPYYSRFQEFHLHVEYLASQDFSSLTMDEVVNGISGGRDAKRVAITFDDGQLSDYIVAFPELAKRNMRGTFYVITDDIEKEGRLTWSQIREMQDHGMEIGSHSCSHQNLLDLNDQELKKEIYDSKEILENRLGRPIHSFSVPFGFVDTRVIRMALEVGYRTISTSKVELVGAKRVPPIFGRIGIRRGDGVEQFRKVVEMDRLTIGKLVMEDRLKAFFKRCLGRPLWHKLRNRLLSQTTC